METIIVELPDGSTKELHIKRSSIRADRLIESLGFFPETALIIKNGELICDDEKIKAGEKVKLLCATSRG